MGVGTSSNPVATMDQAAIDAMFAEMTGGSITGAATTREVDGKFTSGKVTGMSVSPKTAEKLNGKAKTLNTAKATQISDTTQNIHVPLTNDEVQAPIPVGLNPQARIKAALQQAAKTVDAVTTSNSELHGASAVKAAIQHHVHVTPSQEAEAHLPNKHGKTSEVATGSRAAAVKASRAANTSGKGGGGIGGR